MREVSTALSPGGLFLATTIDCTILAETLLLVRHGGTLPAYLTCSTDQGTSKLLYSNDIGHPLLRLSLSEASVHSLLHGDGNGIGIEYTFTLLDSSDSSAVDAPEYIIPQGEVLQTLLAAHGLRLVEAVNFQTLFHRLVDRPGSAEMMMRMHVLNMEGTMTDAEWAIARLYTALVIEKVDSNASCGGVGDIWRSMFGTASAPASHQDDMEVVTACVDYDPTEGLSSPPHSPPGTPPRRTSICVAEPCCPPPAHYPMSPSTRTASNTAPLKWFPSVYETAPGEAIALADLPALQARLQAAAVGRNKVEAKEEEQVTPHLPFPLLYSCACGRWRWMRKRTKIRKCCCSCGNDQLRWTWPEGRMPGMHWMRMHRVLSWKRPSRQSEKRMKKCKNSWTYCTVLI